MSINNNQNNENVITKTSHQRLTELEDSNKNVVESISDLSDSLRVITLQLANVTNNLNSTINLVNMLKNELASTINLLGAGQTVNQETLRVESIKNTVKFLENQVKMLKEQGALEEATSIQEDSFVVGQQYRGEELVTPRIQFLFSELSTEDQQSLLNKAPGETVDMGENQPSLYILEVYKTLED
jgi:hypothetical protein